MSSWPPSDAPGPATEVRPVGSLSEGERAAMLALMAAHYENVAPGAFAADLAAKDAAVLLRDAAGRLRGFSTLARSDVEAAGRRASVWFSGDTVVEAAHRHTAALPRAWSRFVHADARDRAEPTYWFLISSGPATYRFLPTFYRDFLPAPGRAPDRAAQAVLDAAARARFGRRYDAARGIVRLAHPTPLRPDAAALPDARAADPHVAFFLARNPGWTRGDELACLCRVAPDNLTPAGRRMVGPDLAAPLPALP